MPSARISRGVVTLAASAITAVYAAGYLHTQAADSALGDSTLTTPVATDAPSALVIATSTPLSTPTPGVITDQAVELYADQHHVSWDQARADMKASGWVEQQPSPTAVATSTPVAVATTPTTRPLASTAARPTLAPTVRPTATSAPRAAQVAPTATPARSAASSAAFKDGTYTGLGTSRRGNIQVSLAVQSGRIASVTITGATTEYPTRLISGLPAEVVSRQSAQVDSVSGATYSAQAFRAAVQQALQTAKA